MGLSVGVAGATGAVGEELLRLLSERRRLPVGSLRAFASAGSAGRRLPFAGGEVLVEDLGRADFGGLDLVFFSAGAARSREFAPAAVAAGAVVVDNSSAFRMDPAVPLVIPEVNRHALAAHRGIVANPNCTTAVALMAVAPLHRAVGLRSLRVASYQAASGAGARAMAELLTETGRVLAGERAASHVFPWPLPFNAIPHIGAFLPDAYTEEERKMREESRRILEAPGLRVSATCVRVPVLRSHCVAVWAETEGPLVAREARALLEQAEGVKVLDDPERLAYPMPVSATREDRVLVGRIRDGDPPGHEVLLFAAGDQLLKGAALNAVQIAETLAVDGLL